jgi:two-component system chemotaxis response regulator CheB
MMMPVISGLAATEYIMAHCPTPILIVSASVNRGEVFRTYEALAAGAVDVLDKPTGDEPAGAWERKLAATIKLVARIRVITHPRARLRELSEIATPRTVTATTNASIELVALGASTGGPGALVEVLHALPARRVPILIVLHINQPFGSSFADWLDRQTSHRVRFAVNGEPLDPSHVVLAPPDHHLLVERKRHRLTRDPERFSCRPSVDVLFESIAAELAGASAAALLTGMGRDGAAGLRAIRDRGGVTIAQDEATCVVFGMPREAIQLGAASRVLPLPEIGPALAGLIGGQKGTRP